ncbi:unnamed protein product, partial [Mesorhabditis belari]|uniref:G-protein coupled receptors family 1 profile domain-containing protein n=1 Tax=Mesorhabditis belari TaxID=2138241 RepID=A0AAF3ER59_9BILA
MDDEQHLIDFQLSHKSYIAELWIYGIGVFLGTIAVIVTARRLYGQRRNNFVIAARLMSYKVSLTIADLIILFIYAPTQFIWISTFYWYGGDFMCRAYKFIMTFGFHLTANMQVLIALDRLYITSRLNHVTNVRKNSGQGRFTRYGHNAYIVFAYLLAFSCALPQLFVFQLTQLENGSTQCTSVWTLARKVYYQEKAEYFMKELERSGKYNLDIKLTESDLDHIRELAQSFNITIPKEILKLEKEKYQFLFIEQIYNIFHLASICVIPYLIELLCYASILYLLKGAKKGQFLSINDIAKMRWKWCALPSLFRRRPKYKQANDGQISLNTERTDFGDCERLQVKNGTLDDENCVKNALISEDHSARRSSLIISFDGRSTISSDCATAPLVSDSTRCHSSNTNPNSERSTHSTSPGLLLSVQNVLYKYKRGSVATPGPLRPGWIKNLNEKRRASCPESVHKDVKPWMNTVAVARRNTRRKAFWMLTLNLIFWAPYCILGIVTAVTVFENYIHFQFVCALLVFNAVTNILL